MFDEFKDIDGTLQGLEEHEAWMWSDELPKEYVEAALDEMIENADRAEGMVKRYEAIHLVAALRKLKRFQVYLRGSKHRMLARRKIHFVQSADRGMTEDLIEKWLKLSKLTEIAYHWSDEATETLLKLVDRYPSHKLCPTNFVTSSYFRGRLCWLLKPKVKIIFTVPYFCWICGNKIGDCEEDKFEHMDMEDTTHIECRKTKTYRLTNKNLIGGFRYRFNEIVSHSARSPNVQELAQLQLLAFSLTHVEQFKGLVRSFTKGKLNEKQNGTTHRTNRKRTARNAISRV